MNAVAVLVHEDEPRIEYSFWYKVGGSMYRLVDRGGRHSVFTYDEIRL